MTKRLACPECGDYNIKPWALGKMRCSECNIVFARRLAKSSDYVPKTRRPTRSISDRQERLNAKRIGGQRTLASGATPVDKGDVKAFDTRMECKSTGKKSFSLKKAELEKIESQAQDDEIPVFCVEFRDDGGTSRPKSYYVLTEGWYLQMLEAIRADRDD